MNMTNIKKPNLVDAYDMSQKCPDTFSIPSDDEIRLIKPNTFVKVCVEDKERFWVEVKLIEGNNTLFSQIPCGLFIPGSYYLEYNYNGKNVENAIQIKKSLTKSSFVAKGGKPKADLVATNWLRK